MGETPWLSDEEMRLFRAFLAASSGVTSKLDQLLKSTSGLSLDDYEVLVHLSEAPDHRVRMSDLSALLLHSRSRLTQRIDRLVARGLVLREKCDSDARGMWAVLTSTGLDELTRTAPLHLSHVREHLFDQLSHTDLPAITDALERLASGVRPLK